MEKSYNERSNKSLKKFKRPKRRGSGFKWPQRSTKVATVMLDEDAASKMKRKKEVKKERED